MIKLRALYLNYFSDKMISYVALRIIKYFNNSCFHATIMGYSADNSVIDNKNIKYFCNINKKLISKKIYKNIFPSFLWSFLLKITNDCNLKNIGSYIFYLSVRKNEIIYLFPNTPLFLYRKLKINNSIIISERINTMQYNSKKILDNEYELLGVECVHGITEKSSKEEIEKLNLSDIIFSPSPAVSKSIVEAGIPERKIINTSYGLDPSDILPAPEDKFLDDNPVHAIFVGRICIRKGVHLLLKAWEKAKIEGTLTLVGNIANELLPLVESHLNGQDVFHVPFVEDLKSIYSRADIFILPSLEEGSPLVTYLALGASLPSIVSYMGAGGVVRDRKDGLIIDPHDIDSFATAIRNLANTPLLRREMALSARKRSYEYTWEKVSIERRELLIKN